MRLDPLFVGFQTFFAPVAWPFAGPLEATRLAGFSAAEARRFFGPPPELSPAIERDYLTPWPADTAEKRFLERFRSVIRN